MVPAVSRTTKLCMDVAVQHANPVAVLAVTCRRDERRLSTCQHNQRFVQLCVGSPQRSHLVFYSQLSNRTGGPPVKYSTPWGSPGGSHLLHKQV